MIAAAWRVVALLCAVVGGVCAGLGLAWHVPQATGWGAALLCVAVFSVLE